MTTNEVKLLPCPLCNSAMIQHGQYFNHPGNECVLAFQGFRNELAERWNHRPTTVVAGERQSVGVPASPSGHSRAEPEEVSALRASVPNAVTRAIKRLSPAQKSAVLSLSFERPRLLNHRESVSVLVMERVELEPCVFAQLTKHSYASEGWRSTPTGQLTDLGEAVRCRLASAIEARRAATPESGAVHESATAASGDAQ